MSFEIFSNSGEPRLLSVMQSTTDAMLSGGGGDFVDSHGRRYSVYFDGINVIFNDGSADRIGYWLQGSAATVIQRTRLLPDAFRFTWVSPAAAACVVELGWLGSGSHRRLEAGRFFCVHPRSRLEPQSSGIDPPADQGEDCTGADSSHVTIPVAQTGSNTTGEIHVGEFNPLTGFGVGFVLHHLEGWM